MLRTGIEPHMIISKLHYLQAVLQAVYSSSAAEYMFDNKDCLQDVTLLEISSSNFG